MKTKKEATLGHAFIPIIVLMVVLSVAIIGFGADPHIPLLVGIIVASLVAMFSLGYTWDEVEKVPLKQSNYPCKQYSY